MQNLAPHSFMTDLHTRAELIALSQLTALHLNPSLFEQEKPVIIMINGSGNAGKSLIPTAFSAQLIDIRTSALDVIGETTWRTASENDPVSLKLHFIDADVACQNPYDLLKTPDGRRLAAADIQQAWKEKGDIIFLQNVPAEFRDLADLEIVMSRIDGFEDWDRIVSMIVHNARIYDQKFADFFENVTRDKIESAAAQIPPDYLMADGGVYSAVLDVA